VNDHERPVSELARIYELHQALFGKTPPERWLEVDAELRTELEQRLARLGYTGDLGAAYASWAGNENLEERVDGIDAVDPVVLGHLRGLS
jgi:uncharacterized Ntn-hydrolase superfamily protein